MQEATFDRLVRVIYDESGIRIRRGKESMLSARLGKRVKQMGLTTVEEYTDYLEEDVAREIVQLLDIISTNVTHFFRENEHFEFLSKAMRGWMAEGQDRFRIWCAASSTGEEPYTLAMTMHEAARAAGKVPDMKVLATDISTRVLAIAKRGSYSESDLSEVPASLRARYFVKETGAQDGNWRVTDEMRATLAFRRLNLSCPPFPMKGPMDIVFCRNVMFYFDDPVKNSLVDDAHRLLRKGGYLITGKSESIPALRASKQFERAGPAIYKKIV